MTERTSAAVTEADIARWYEGCVFSSDWTTSHFPVWTDVLGAYRHRPVRVLEIGSWEGRSALFFLHFLAESSLTCVDTFEGSVEHHENASLAPSVGDVERRFDANTAGFAHRLEKIRGTSGSVLPLLGIAARRFEVVYVDGSHHAADVYRDAALAWSLVDPGGLVIFDDYDWNLMETESERPRLGIETFLRTVPGRFREIHRDYQLIVEKL
ncbi:class I SAM-dependent methyltransferase [Streptomyces zingiberis]|uniref:Class I SAM-dependent methyltransferase n=1 Tax=Streptomyces zingiberis TaxID=2053010 RepID=A0ABX1C2Q7_9ACTN|nr:class I SAM-dependent methyltransferase [Streptomyces zingiberis]NJQ03071.1 class I SAM-dependent methyltransferase [Streptomyces zingiberis]